MKAGASPTTTRKRPKAPADQLAFWENEPSPAPRSQAVSRRSKKAPPPSREVARRVGVEILEGNLSPAEWAAALADSEGSNSRAISEYARRRIEMLEDLDSLARRKETEKETRMRQWCGSAASSLPETVRTCAGEPPSPVGVMLGFLGTWGICAALLTSLGTASGTALVASSLVSALLLCVLGALGYAFSRRSAKRILSGDRALLVGSALCCLSLACAFSVAFHPPARSVAEKPAVPSR